MLLASVSTYPAWQCIILHNLQRWVTKTQNITVLSLFKGEPAAEEGRGICGEWCQEKEDIRCLIHYSTASTSLIGQHPSSLSQGKMRWKFQEGRRLSQQRSEHSKEDEDLARKRAHGRGTERFSLLMSAQIKQEVCWRDNLNNAAVNVTHPSQCD